VAREFYVPDHKEKVYSDGWTARWAWVVRQRVGENTRRVCTHATRAEARRCCWWRNGDRWLPCPPCEVPRD